MLLPFWNRKNIDPNFKSRWNKKQDLRVLVEQIMRIQGFGLNWRKYLMIEIIIRGLLQWAIISRAIE